MNLDELINWLKDENKLASLAMSKDSSNYWFGRFCTTRELLTLLVENKESA